jgi:hypothetical protein
MFGPMICWQAWWAPLSLWRRGTPVAVPSRHPTTTDQVPVSANFSPEAYVCSEQTALADHVCTRRDPT